MNLTGDHRRRGRGRRAAISIIGAVLLLLGSETVVDRPAAADPGHAGASGKQWSLADTADVLTPNGHFLADSCTGPTACIAVGSYTDRSGAASTLAAVWNGTDWQKLATPVISAGTLPGLDGVSCSSPTACTAVGSYTDGAGAEVALAEAWDGTAWKVQAIPDPSGGIGDSLSGVSCSSPNACTAVGSYEGDSGTDVTLAEAWDGTAWEVQSTPDPARGAPHALAAVSCSSPDACVAVGSSNENSATELTEVWNGTAWRIQPSPNPPGSTFSSLKSVSCSSPTACTAVGSYSGETLAEAWNGAAWKIEATPDPDAETNDMLNGVSCASRTVCTAVGEYTSSTGDEVAFAEQRSGGTWRMQSIPYSAGTTDDQLDGVSCASLAICSAVGFSTEGTLAEQRNGSTWTTEASPSPVGVLHNGLSGISCTSPTVCTAVGSAAGGTLAEQRNGGTWTLRDSRNPADSTGSNLSGVSCTAPTSCTAVGSFQNKSGTNVTLAEAWDGTRWRIQTTPNPGGSTQSGLYGVSCLSTEDCIAVGSSNANTLVESWNGTKWTIEASPNVTGAPFSVLNGVSCTGPAACIAVGYAVVKSGSSYTEATLAESWNGSKWIIQDTPAPATFSYLTSVSCTTPTMCTAVGYLSLTPLAEVLQGTTWTVQTTPSPAGADGGNLYGVSCSAATCTAVGSYYSESVGSGTEMTLAETRTGSTWSVTSTPNPADGHPGGATLYGVSGTTAVGSYANTSDNVQTLGETEGG